MSQSIPLSEQLRPTSLNEFIGQDHLVGSDGLIRHVLSSNEPLPSMIFWGPPSCGKTTLAKIIAHSIDAEFFTLSAVIDGKEALKKIISNVDSTSLLHRNKVLFIDEIHRWNKAQQDALLPFIENGTITLLGATTENPSFTINSALLSRTRVVVFHKLSENEVYNGLKKAVDTLSLKIKENELRYLAQLCDGDIRFGLNTLEILSSYKDIDKETINLAAQKSINYDRNGDEHYNIVSAVHKSLRSSNPSAALYWVMRMLEGGEDPLYIARRLLRFASEDIGNANPNALLLANEVYTVVERLGMPECNTAISQLVEYLGNSPKSNSAYTAITSAKQDIIAHGTLAVPMHFRNASTKLMKDLGYGKGYEYDPEVQGGKSSQECFPAELKGRKYFVSNTAPNSKKPPE
jgi:putative ATPase